MAEPIIIGIDPGLDGAVVAMCADNIWVHDIPTVGTKPREYDSDECARLVRRVGLISVWCEHMSPNPKLRTSASTLIGIGRAEGLWIGICGALGLPLHLVAPAKWKRRMGLLGKSKDDSRALAMRLFPSVDDRLRRKCDHGRAEALLIAEYGRREMGASNER